MRKPNPKYIATLATTDRSDADYVPTIVLHNESGKHIVASPVDAVNIIKFELEELLVTEKSLEVDFLDGSKLVSFTRRTLEKRVIERMKSKLVYCIEIRFKNSDRRDVYTISEVR